MTLWETARRYRDSTSSADETVRQLNVDAVLPGTFQLSGDRLLATLSLVEEESGLQSWADPFEHPCQDLFRMQREIDERVARSLQGELSGEARGFGHLTNPRVSITNGLARG